MRALDMCIWKEIEFAPSTQYRMNFKANVVPWTTIFAHAAGFKIVWPLPEELGHHRAPRRMLRELHEATELMYDRYLYNKQFIIIRTERCVNNVDSRSLVSHGYICRPKPNALTGAAVGNFLCFGLVISQAAFTL